MKILPQRTCIGCNTKKNKNELLRIVKNKSGEISIDLTGKKDGRGTYICKNKECLEKAIKNKRMSRAFEMEIPKETYLELANFINGGEIIG